MKSAEQSIETSKRPWGDAATTSGTMPATDETFMDSTAAVNPVGDVEDFDPTVAPPLSLHAMMQSFITTKAAHG